MSKLTMPPLVSGDASRIQVISHLEQYLALKFPRRVQSSAILLKAQEEYILQNKGNWPYVRMHLENKRIGGGMKEPLEKFIKDSSTGWGWTVVRCTYQSQSQWEEFLALLIEDLDFVLRHPADRTIRDALYCQVIEDPSLDEAGWKRARETFDQWALTEMREKLPPVYTQDWPASGNISQISLKSALCTSPRWRAFVYADQESVDSITGSGRCWKIKEQGGGYFINIVTSGIAPVGYYEVDDNDVWLKDYESQNVDRQVLRQKVRGCRLLELHRAMLGDLWPDRYIVNDDGITELL